MPVQAMPLLAWPGAWWRRDARTSCSAVALPVAKRRQRGISKTKPKQTAPTRSREAEGAQATAGTAAAPVEAARFETGDLVIIDGLTSRPELNGCNARVRGSDPAKGRLVLDLLHSGVGGTQISVKCVNCRKANVEEANEVVATLEHELAEAQVRLEAKSDELLQAKAAAQVDAQQASDAVDAKVDALRAELRSALQASERATESTLAVKASHAQVEALVAEQGLATLSALGGKADVEAVGAALAAKASRAELLEMVDGRSSELRDETQRLLAERVARPELQTHTLETDRRFKELRAEVSNARLDAQSHAAEVQGSLAAKASCADVEACVERGEMERQLQRRPERAEVEAALGDAGRRQAEAAQAAREAKADLEARAERLERQLESLAAELRAG